MLGKLALRLAARPLIAIAFYAQGMQWPESNVRGNLGDAYCTNVAQEIAMSTAGNAETKEKTNGQYDIYVLLHQGDD